MASKLLILDDDHYILLMLKTIFAGDDYELFL